MSGGDDAVEVHYDYRFNKSDRKIEVVHHDDAAVTKLDGHQGRRQPPSSMPCVFALNISSKPSLSRPLMRLNIWIILAALLALLAIIRYMQRPGDTQVCVDDPTAPVCHR